MSSNIEMDVQPTTTVSESLMDWLRERFTKELSDSEHVEELFKRTDFQDIEERLYALAHKTINYQLICNVKGWGGCLDCGEGRERLYVGDTVWGACKEHKKRWRLVSDMDGWKKNAAVLSDYEEVLPIFPVF